MATTRIRKGPSGPFEDPSVDPADITPGPLNTALRSVDDGSGDVAAWKPATGGGGLFLVDYYERAGNNWADALITALTEVTARPLAIVLPAAEMEIDKRIGDFAGGDGLAGGLVFVGFAGATRFVRPQGAVYTSMFAFDVDSDNVSFTGVGWHAVDTAVVGLLAVHTNNPGAFDFVQCSLSTGDVPTNQGNGIALGLFGARKCSFVNGKLDHAQVGFAGLGYGCNGAVFANNECTNVHDFAVSAVCGPPEVTPLEIRNVSIANNTIDGVNGTGAIFVGSDGGSDAADVVSGVSITGNVITPVVELGHVGPRTMIAFVGGLVTRQINIGQNVIADDDASSGSFGISVSTPPGATEFVGLSINGNTIGRLGVDGGANGIYCDVVILDNSQIVDNVLDGNRGIFVANPVKVKIAGNQVFRATSHAIHVRASLRNVSEIDVSKNFAETVGAFSNALLFEVDGAFSMQAWIDDNKLSSATGSALAFIPDGGSGEFYQTDNKFLSGGINADMTLATIFERDPS